MQVAESQIRFTNQVQVYQIVNAMRRIGKMDTEGIINTVRYSKDIRYHRNKLEFTFVIKDGLLRKRSKPRALSKQNLRWDSTGPIHLTKY